MQHAVSKLYAELETIRSIVCQHCNDRISAVSTSGNNAQADLATSTTTLSHSSVVPTTSNIFTPSEPETSHPPLQTSPTQVVKEAAVIAKPTIEKLRNHYRSVTHNSSIEKVLDITFVYAFEPALEVNVVRFSPDGNLLAVGLTKVLGRIIIYDMRTMSMKWYACFYLLGA